MFTINSFSISKLNNAEITGFFINLQKQITVSTAANLGISEIMTAFDSTLQQLIDQVYTTNGSEHTAAMQAADLKRDQIYKRIRLRLQMVDVAEDSAAIRQYKDIVNTHLLGKYGAGVPQLPYQEETAIIKGFLYDLEDKLGEDGGEALGITDDVLALESANNEFIDAYNAKAAARAEAKAQGDAGLTARLRAQMCAFYQQICFTTQYLANSTDEDNATKATACQAFIAVLNVILSDAKQRYNQRINGSSTSDNGESGNGGSDNGGGSGSEGGDDSGDTGDTGDDNGEGGEGGSDNGGGSGDDNGGSDNGGDNGGNGGSSGGEQSSGDDNDPNKPNENGNLDGDELTF